MSKTVDDLAKVFRAALFQHLGNNPYATVGEGDRAGIIAVVTALRDELGDPSTFKSAKQECCGRGVPNHSNTAEECCCLPDTWLLHEEFLGRINEILAPREGGNGAAGGSTSNASKAIGEGGASVPGTPTPAAPAPTVGQRLIKAAHEAAAIARGDDDLVVSPTGLGLSPAAPAPVCVWGRGRDVSGNTVWGLPSCGPWTYAGVDYETCPNCKKPISFKTEAQR